MSSFAERLEDALTMRDMSPAELSRATGIGEGAISQYRKGICKAAQKNLEKIAHALNVSIPWLMGVVDTPTPSDSLPSNVVPLQPMKKIPLVGRIACGTPILAEQNIEDYIDLPGHIHADYALTCKGDSMINTGIQDSDVVYIHQQPEVENGQIAAVLVDEDEATLKRFYYDGDIITLVAENSRIPPMVFSGSDIDRVRVLGLAVAYTHILD